MQHKSVWYFVFLNLKVSMILERIGLKAEADSLNEEASNEGQG